MTQDEIINVVCEVCGVTIKEVASGSRKTDPAMARQLIAWFLYWDLRYSQSDAARGAWITRQTSYDYTHPKFVYPKRRDKALFRARFDESRWRLSGNKLHGELVMHG